MSIPREYFDLVEDVRDEVRDEVVVIDDDTDYIPSSEVNDVCDNYLDTLRMERCKGEEHTLELVPMYKEEELELTEVHIEDAFFDSLFTETADTIISLPECDGMSDEFLLTQPLDAIHMYLEEIVKEIAHV